MDHLIRDIDRRLVELDQRVDWLYYLSPVGNDAMWQAFEASRYQQPPILKYCEIPADYSALLDQLQALPVDQVKNPAVQRLFLTKQDELMQQVQLVLCRDQPGFVEHSIALFGGNDAELLQKALTILNQFDHMPTIAQTATSMDIKQLAEQHVLTYREYTIKHDLPVFFGTVNILDDLNSMMMVHQGHLQIARSATASPARVRPLVTHEVDVHMVTRYNGRQQPLTLLEAGLADYDALQEGLATLSEYLIGYLSPQRLQVLAARVVASYRVVHQSSFMDIYSELREFHLNAYAAFDITVRALRGGGLTKDAVYLEGLDALHQYLINGGDIEFLHAGKFALSQLGDLHDLYQAELLHGPALLPIYLQNPQVQQRLQQLGQRQLHQLYQTQPQL